jgi:hypothetical protein
MTTLSYSVAEPALRSPVEEWQPHAKQSEKTIEWWYVTAVVHDTAGNPYFLVWCPFHFSGEKTSPASAGLPRDQRAIAALTGLTDYRDNFRIADFPAAVASWMSSRTRATSSSKVLRASSMTTREKRLEWRLLNRWTFASCRMRHTPPTSIDARGRMSGRSSFDRARRTPQRARTVRFARPKR